MPLLLTDHVALPAHTGSGGFDHAAVHAATGHVYVAHTANDAVDVFDPASRKFLFSVPGLTAVAGALVSDEAQLIFSSNRGEDTIGIFAPGPDPEVTKVAVGMRPNGLAFDPVRRNVLAANVGDAAIAGSCTLSIVALDTRAMRASIEAPGRTRWTVYDPDAAVFYVNIVDPALIVVVDARDPTRIARALPVPSVGPHGLDFDPATHRLFCACDSGRLITLDARSGKVLDEQALSGGPDVVFFSGRRQRLYVASGDPGVIDVFDTATMRNIGRVETERGAHTFSLAATGDEIHVFLPQTHRAAIYREAEAT